MAGRGSPETVLPSVSFTTDLWSRNHIAKDGLAIVRRTWKVRHRRAARKGSKVPSAAISADPIPTRRRPDARDRSTGIIQ